MCYRLDDSEDSEEVETVEIGSMQIKRDYSQPFFSTRRRRRTGGSRFLFLYGLFVGAFLVVVYTQFDRLQLAALDAVGMAPTSTPFASTMATGGADAFQNGDVALAAEMFGQAHRQQPNNLDYAYEYGKMLIELDQAEEVIRELRHFVLWVERSHLEA